MSGSTREIRRTDVVDIFPNREWIIRLARAVLAVQRNEWAERCAYLGVDVLTRCRAVMTENAAKEEGTE